MKDNYPTDTHRLMFHPERVAAWKAGQSIYPIYVELSPSGMCNHRCTFCALDFMGYKNRFLDTEKTIAAIRNMAKLGVKAIMFGGEGEPLLHKDIDVFAREINTYGIDLGITTNGSAMGTELASTLIMNSRWIKVSLNAGTEEDYHKIHKADHWERVWENIAKALEFRNANQKAYGIQLATIGVQAVLLEENYSRLWGLVQKAREVGIDYVVLKPYSQHPSSHKKMSPVDAESFFAELNHLKYYETDSFKVIIRENAIYRGKRTYSFCHALPFWSYIDSAGNVWSCSAMMPDERFKLGNIYMDDLSKILGNQPYLPTIETAGCRVNCRMDECNRYLEEIRHPGPSANFI